MHEAGEYLSCFWLELIANPVFDAVSMLFLYVESKKWETIYSNDIRSYES